MNTLPLVLASTSTYRSELLARLRIPFQTTAPNVDETPLPDETAQQTSWRLSRDKAQAARKSFPDALILGSDQVALLGDRQLGKPMTHVNARQQLKDMSGQTVHFYTALTLLNSRSGELQTDVAINSVHFRTLSEQQIENYLIKDQPYNCAGSFKSESLGIALISSMEGEDPYALVGLPLILLVNMLASQGLEII